MNDLQHGNRLHRTTLMWSSVGVLYIMLGLASAGLFLLESGSRLQVIGIVCTVVGFYFLTLLVMSWRKQERMMGMQPPGPIPSPASAKTRLPFRIAGLVLAIAALATGCF